MVTLGFIGAGPVGTTFGVRLAQKGYPVVGVTDKHQAAAEGFAGRVPGSRVYAAGQALADAAEMVFITTADDVIAAVASGLTWRRGQTVVHCSGASTVEVLEGARRQGAAVGSIHPCQSFAGIEQAIANLPGSTFAIEAEEPVKTTLTDMARALDGAIVHLSSEDKVLYHAAATVGFPGCLTGPIARGDVATVRRHLSSLQKHAPDMLALYKALGRFTVPIGEEKGGLSAEKAAELRRLLAEQG